MELHQKIINNLYLNNILTLVELLSYKGEVLFFGGYLRSILEDRNDFRDIDIILDSACDEDLLDLFKLLHIEYRINKFGGYKVIYQNVKFDIWRLENTWAFRNKILVSNQENLEKSVFLSIDGIIYNFNKKILNKSLYEKTLNERIIDIVLEKNDFIELNLLRSLVLSNQYDLELSNRLKDYLRILYNSRGLDFIEILYSLQEKRYSKEVFKKNEIVDFIKSII